MAENKGSIFGSIAAGVIQAAAVTESAFDKVRANLVCSADLSLGLRRCQ